MGQDTSQERTQQLTAEELRGEIEDVRRDLGDTAAALAAKTDVKTRARERADELKLRAKENPKPLAIGAGAFVAVLVAGRIIGRRRR
jgi:Protein of unknown function (DUF3618)